MAIGGILDTSLSGLFANQEALRATANNISNVNTEGYSRLRVSQGTRVVNGESFGVEIQAIERVVDTFLSSATRTAISATEEAAALNEVLTRLQGFLGDPSRDSTLSAQLEQAFTAIDSLALAPQETLRRREVLNEVQDYLSAVSTLQSQIQSLRAEAARSLEDQITEVNQILQQIAELNPLLQRQLAIGGETGGLNSQLDAALRRLSEYLPINVTNNSDGSVTVATDTGLQLVDFGLTQFAFTAPGQVGPTTDFSPITLSRADVETLELQGVPIETSGRLTSGSLAGLLRARDDDLVDLSTTLGELSARVADTFNAVHNAFSAAPAPGELNGKPTLLDSNQLHGFTGITEFAIVDANNALVAKSTIDFSTPALVTIQDVVNQVNTDLGAAGTLTLGADGALEFSAAAATGGVVISDVPGSESSRGGRSFSHFFGLNDLIVADNPGIYDTGLVGGAPTNFVTGQSISFRVDSASGSELATITINPQTNDTVADFVADLNDPATGLGSFFTFTLNAAGALEVSATGPFAGASFAVVADSTDFGTGLGANAAFGLDQRQRALAASNVQIRADIADDPTVLSFSDFNNAAAVGASVLSPGDQRGALALQAIQTQSVDFAAAGQLPGAASTLSQYTARFLENTGQLAARAETREVDNRALFQELDQRRADVEGVNLDEELSNLVVFQNAYSASARVITTVQQLFDDLLSVV